VNRPPVLARALLALLVPRRLHEAIAGDLEEQWHEAGKGDVEFWAGTLRSIRDCWRERLFRRAHPRVHKPRGNIMRGLLFDVRYGIRMMIRTPGFTFAAVGTLGIGIGATTAIFSMINILSLKPLPYRDPSRVSFVFGAEMDSGERMFSVPLADFLDMQRQATSLEAISAYSYLSANLTGSDLPERVQAYRVTPNTFDLLGVPAAIGRTFSERDASADAAHVAIISDGLWRRLFGADVAVVGRTIMLNGSALEIVGVMPRTFEYPVFNFKGDVWVPWTIRQTNAADRGSLGSGTLVARIKEGVRPAQAQSELQTIMRHLAEEHPAANARRSVTLVEMGKLDDEEAGSAGLIVSVTVAAVLLLACANVANLLFARGISRAREIAVRTALGASRRRVARQLLVESLVLACCGGTVGVALAYAGLDWLKRSLPEILLTTIPNIDALGVHSETLAFALATTLAATLVVGLLPALRAARAQQYNALKESASVGGSRPARRFRTAVVIAEVALATLLVITGALLVRGYARLQNVNPGFAPDGLLTMALTLPEDRYATPESRRQFYQRSVERIEQLPGVESAAFVNVLPFSTYDRGMRFVIEGAPLPSPGEEPHTALRVATPGYLSTMNVPLHEGRNFDRRDTATSPLVAVVNQAFTKRYLGGGPALDRRLRFGRANDEGPWITIVGTIGDVHHSDLTSAPTPELYAPISQASGMSMMMLGVRVKEGRAEDMIAPVRAAITEVDPLQPVYHVKSMNRLMADSLLPRSMAATVVGTFSVVSLILALVGVYGVVSYAVTQQMVEFGIRLALGATPRGLMALIMRRSAFMMIAGVAVGVAGAAALSSVLESLLFGVSALDASTYAIAVLMLLTMGLLACFVPAWRATSAEPLSALRAE
jgi:putative ABC transport system permease protein